MANKTVKEHMKEIKIALKDKTAELGSERSLKLLKSGKLAAIFLAQNCADAVRKDIQKYAELTRTQVTELEIPNAEFGALCRKPYAISVLSIMKV